MCSCESSMRSTESSSNRNHWCSYSCTTCQDTPHYNTSIYLSTYLRTYAPTYLRTHTNTHTHACMHACMHTWRHTFTHTHTHTRTHAHTHRHTHTDTHTHTHSDLFVDLYERHVVPVIHAAAPRMRIASKFVRHIRDMLKTY